MFDLRGTPVWCTLMEIMLAGMGCTLSNYFLDKSWGLVFKCAFNITVDEIFTAGRAVDDHFMLTLNCHIPESFKAAVSHIILGEWTNLGLCCVRKDFHEECNIDKDRCEIMKNPIINSPAIHQLLKNVSEKIARGEHNSRRVEVIKDVMRHKNFAHKPKKEF